MVNSNLNIQSLFPTNANAGGQVDTGGVSPVVGNNKGKAISGGKSNLAKVKRSTPQIQRAKAELQRLQSPVKQANTQNSASVTDFRLAQDDAIKGFQASLGNVEVPITAFKSDSSVSTFNLAAAQGALKTSAFDFTTDTLTPASLDAKDSTEIANSEGNNALSSLGKAMGSFDGGLGDMASGAGLVTSGIATAAAVGWTGFGLAPALAQIAGGVAKIGSGFMGAGEGQYQSAEAEQTGTEATAQYTSTAEALKKNDAAIAQLKNFYKGANNQAFPVLAQAQRGNDNLVAEAALLGANVQAPATPANPADPANPTGASNGTPTVPAPANVADASWTTPATTTTGDTAQAGGSTAPTALGVQAPLAGGNTAPEPPQAGGLTDAEVAFMKAFQANSGVVNAANGQLQGALGSAPTGFNTEGLASQTVTDASQSQPLQELYARLEAKKNQAEGQQAQPSQGLGTAFIGNGVNPQWQVDPNAPQGKVATAQAPQAPPATPASTAAAPTRTLTIPQVA
jgi:hypothetical protein